MIVSIHQPSYFPWLGLLDKIAGSQLFILLDDVQLADRAFQHRNIFIDINGRTRYLTIPIDKKNYRAKTIKEMTISDEKWQGDHKKFIMFNYKKSRYYDEIFEAIKSIYERKYTFLIDVLLDSMRISMDLFDIKTPLEKQSALTYKRESKKSDLMLELVHSVQGDVYLTGLGSRDYLKLEDFSGKNIKVVFNKFEHPTYAQINSDDFVSGLSCVETLFSIGIENSRKLLATPREIRH